MGFRFLYLVFPFFVFTLSGQDKGSGTPDYKDNDQFNNYQKRRKAVAAWQINQLKTGALVVKLKTNRLVIDALKKNGNALLAEKKRLETAAININVMRSYLYAYRFSKVYFIEASSVDTLLKGARTGIFLDTTLVENPEIRMTENFYLLAESDRIYNSTIGFVPEDSARFVKETGTATEKLYQVVLKNKYGHQLKPPFPFKATGRSASNKQYMAYVTVYGITVPLNITGVLFRNPKDVVYYRGTEGMHDLEIPKRFTFDYFSVAVEQLNAELEDFYRGSLRYNTDSAELKPFLY